MSCCAGIRFHSLLFPFSLSIWFCPDLSFVALWPLISLPSCSCTSLCRGILLEAAAARKKTWQKAFLYQRVSYKPTCADSRHWGCLGVFMHVVGAGNRAMCSLLMTYLCSSVWLGDRYQLAATCSSGSETVQVVERRLLKMFHVLLQACFPHLWSCQAFSSTVDTLQLLLAAISIDCGISLC